MKSCTGSPGEMCIPGGEVAFISRLIEESITLKGRVRWYSSMLGKLSSISALVTTLQTNGIENYALTEFIQGTTKRWGIAWSFLPIRPREVTLDSHDYVFTDIGCFMSQRLGLARLPAENAKVCDFCTVIGVLHGTRSTAIPHIFKGDKLYMGGEYRRRSSQWQCMVSCGKTEGSFLF